MLMQEQQEGVGYVWCTAVSPDGPCLVDRTKARSEQRSYQQRMRKPFRIRETRENDEQRDKEVKAVEAQLAEPHTCPAFRSGRLRTRSKIRHAVIGAAVPDPPRQVLIPSSRTMVKWSLTRRAPILSNRLSA